MGQEAPLTKGCPSREVSKPGVVPATLQVERTGNARSPVDGGQQGPVRWADVGWVTRGLGSPGSCWGFILGVVGAMPRALHDPTPSFWGGRRGSERLLIMPLAPRWRSGPTWGRVGAQQPVSLPSSCPGQDQRGSHLHRKPGAPQAMQTESRGVGREEHGLPFHLTAGGELDCGDAHLPPGTCLWERATHSREGGVNIASQ